MRAPPAHRRPSWLVTSLLATAGIPLAALLFGACREIPDARPPDATGASSATAPGTVATATATHAAEVATGGPQVAADAPHDAGSAAAPGPTASAVATPGPTASAVATRVMIDPMAGPVCTGKQSVCGYGPHAACCSPGQTCCAGGAAGSYYCRSGSGPCPPLP